MKPTKLRQLTLPLALALTAGAFAIKAQDSAPIPALAAKQLGLEAKGWAGIYTFGIDPGLTQNGFPAWKERKRNLLLWSNDFSNAAWTKTRASVVAGAAANPVNGTMDAWKLVEDGTASALHYIQAATPAISGGGTFSFYAKAAERSWVHVQLGAGTIRYFDVGAGVAGTGSAAYTATIVSAGNGWYRCSLTGDFTGLVNVYVMLSSGAAGVGYTGDGTSGLYIYGAQLTPGSTLQPYEPTTDQQRVYNWAYTGARKNLFFGSDTQSHWGDISAGVTTVTAGQADPDGGASAWLLQGNNPNTYLGTDDFTQTLANRTVTFSVWLRSSTSHTVRLGISFAAGNNYQGDAQTLTTTWARYTFTKALGSGDTQLMRVYVSHGSGNSTYFCRPQLELGPIATVYERTPYPDLQRGSAAGSDTNDFSYLVESANGFLYSEPLLAEVPTKTGTVTQATFTENGLTNGVRFPAGQQLDYAYRGTTLITGAGYTVSVFVKMDDGSIPSPGQIATNDFQLLGDSGNLTAAVHHVDSYGSGVYRVWATFTATTGGANRTQGIWRAATHTGKGFRATGFMLNPGSTPAEYKKTPGSEVVSGVSFVTDDYALSGTQLSDWFYTGARLNLLKSSQLFSGADWAKTQATITASAIANPLDGKLNAEKLVDTAPNGSHFIGQGSIPTVTGTFSVYAKAGEHSKLMLYGTATVKGRGFDLTNGTTFKVDGVNDSVSYTISPVAGGWYRCSVSVTAETQISVFLVSGTSFNFAGTATSGIYLYGAQLQLGSTPTAYERTPYGIDMAGDWTMLLVGRFDGSAASGSLVSLANGSAADQMIYTRYNSVAGRVIVTSRNGSSYGDSQNLDLSANSTLALVVTSTNGVLKLQRLDTGQAVTGINRSPYGVARLGIAANAISTVSGMADSLKLSLAAIAPTAMSNTQLRNIYKDMRPRLCTTTNGAVCLPPLAWPPPPTSFDEAIGEFDSMGGTFDSPSHI